MEAIPVERIIGFPFAATYSIRGRLVISPEPSLNATTPILFSKSTLSKSKGDDKKMIFFVHSLISL